VPRRRPDPQRRQHAAASARDHARKHETAPPARFTEASLIKELERLGIGRPSTYAPTIATIVRRGYVFRQAKALVPSFTAFAVTKLLREHFGDFVESDFTAEMEDDLDEISRGEREWLPSCGSSTYGDTKHRGLLPAVEHGAEKADYPVLTSAPIRSPASRYACVSDGSGRSSSSAREAPAERHRCPTISHRRTSPSRRRWSWFVPRPKVPACSAPTRRPARTSMF
jgi:hypothetical protein